MFVFSQQDNSRGQKMEYGGMCHTALGCVFYLLLLDTCDNY